jgi:hypothetical protein
MPLPAPVTMMVLPWRRMRLSCEKYFGPCLWEYSL